jgi:polyhydroxybutyrate depolymerase
LRRNRARSVHGFEMTPTLLQFFEAAGPGMLHVKRLAVLTLMAGGLTLVSAPGEAGTAPQSGWIEQVSLTHDGVVRTAWVAVPSGYRKNTPVPLVLSFHGRDSDGMTQAWLTQLHDVGERNTFIVVYPDGVGRSWNALSGTGDAEALNVDDVGYVDALLATLSARFTIDPDRVYASGMSNGAFFAHRLGCERSSRFAAIASVAGQMALALEKVCAPQVPVAVLSFHGKADPVVPYGGGVTLGGGSTLSAEQTAAVWGRLNQAGAQPIETFRKGEVVCRTYQDGRMPVTLCSIETGGHTWPGGNEYAPETVVGPTNRDVSASEMIWQFFAANPGTAKHVSPPRAPGNLRVK